MARTAADVRDSLVMAAALIFASIGAHAEAAFSAEDGNSLYAKCTDQSFYFYQGMCVGYVVGISDADEGRGFR